MDNKLIISATLADDSWGSEVDSGDKKLIEKIHAGYERAAKKIATKWYGKKYRTIEIDFDYVPTSLKSNWFIRDESETFIESDDAADQFADTVWNTYCGG